MKFDPGLVPGGCLLYRDLEVNPRVLDFASTTDVVLLFFFIAKTFGVRELQAMLGTYEMVRASSRPQVCQP